MRTSLSDFKWRLIEMWFGIQHLSLIRRQTNGQFALMHISKPKESILNTCCTTTANNLL